MTTKKKCPSCGVIHTVEMQHQWESNGSRRELSFIQTMDSSNIDGVKLESLVPLGPSDGQELAVEGTWIDDRSVLFKLFRRPVPVQAPAAVQPTTPPVPPRPRTRADMETRAAELGMAVDSKWNNAQLAKALADREKAG